MSVVQIDCFCRHRHKFCQPCLEKYGGPSLQNNYTIHNTDAIKLPVSLTNRLCSPKQKVHITLHNKGLNILIARANNVPTRHVINIVTLEAANTKWWTVLSKSVWPFPIPRLGFGSGLDNVCPIPVPKVYVFNVTDGSHSRSLLAEAVVSKRNVGYCFLSTFHCFGGVLGPNLFHTAA